MASKSITYKSSGVDIDNANLFVKSISSSVASTMGRAVLKRKGSFASLYAMDPKGFKEPVLVSSTDGVGTKLLVAKAAKRHDTIGIDLVAMNVNDILCVGARPLFFLDYIACGKLKPVLLKSVMKGIVKGCQLSGCSLIGGETAEMPGIYKADDYDLAGFAVGVVEKKKIIDGHSIRPGDSLIGLPSSGLHSNGYSLVRKVLSVHEQKKWSRDLLKPTKIYAREVLSILERFDVHGMAHITGGAYYEKLTKILPKGLCFQIQKGSWPIPRIFKVLQQKGNIREEEMFRTLNMGIGLIFVVPEKASGKIRDFLKKIKVRHYEVGQVIKKRNPKIVFKD